MEREKTKSKISDVIEMEERHKRYERKRYEKSEDCSFLEDTLYSIYKTNQCM